MKRNLATVVLIMSAWLVPAMGQTPVQTTAPAKPAEAAPEPKIKVGDMVPDFTLKDQSRKDVTLSSFRGKQNVVLAFYVFAFTGG